MELVARLFVNIMAVIAIAVGIAIGGWWVMGLYAVHSRKEEKELPEVELPSHLHEVISGIPPVMIFFYAFIAISLIVYVLYIWLGGFNY